ASPPLYTARAPEIDEPAPRPGRERFGTTFKGAIDAFYRQIFDVPIYGGAISLAVGPMRGDRSMYLSLQLEHGFTEHGRSMWGGHVGFSPEWALDRVRLGFEVGAGYLS